ncbi:MAG TPA: hypothetical protein VGR10_02615, partial [Thermoleophilaceae bacterium]|nr:hypothetical protein [Thermoleophilaceae bacterium]
MAVAIGGTGLVTYAYFSLASHSLPGADYGRLTLLWSAVFITVSLIHRPVEQLLARSAAERATHRSADSTHLRTAAAIQVALAAAFAVFALALRGPLQDELFGGSAALFWTMVAAVLAYAGSYFARGLLAGTGRLRLYGGLQLAESCLRTGFALAVAVGLASGVSAVALGVAVAPAASLVALSALVASRALRARTFVPPPTASDLLVRARPAESEASPAEPGLTLARGSGYAGGVLLIM